MKAQNAALGGAAGVVVYDASVSEVFPGSSLVSPGAAIPSVLVRRSDGLALLKAIGDRGEGQARLTWRAANLLGTLSGSLTGTELKLKLNLVLSNAWDYIFSAPLPEMCPRQPRRRCGPARPRKTLPGRRPSRVKLGQ